jgi:nicotinamide mononucleotide (NMN) deamidase PncC
MRKLLLALSALAVLGIAGPLSAPAQAEEGRVVIKEHRDHPRFFERFRHHDRDSVRFRDHDRKTVIIKKRGHDY